MDEYQISFSHRQLKILCDITNQQLKKSLSDWKEFSEENKTYDLETLDDDIKSQWEYTCELEEIYDKIASPINESRRHIPNKINVLYNPSNENTITSDNMKSQKDIFSFLSKLKRNKANKKKESLEDVLSCFCEQPSFDKNRLEELSQLLDKLEKKFNDIDK